MQVMRCLAGFFRSCGVDYVFDLSTGTNLALIAAAEEFIERHKKAVLPLPLLASACPGAMVLWLRVMSRDDDSCQGGFVMWRRHMGRGVCRI